MYLRSVYPLEKTDKAQELGESEKGREEGRANIYVTGKPFRICEQPGMMAHAGGGTCL